MLSNGNDGWLMIGSCVDGADSVGASRNTVGDISGQNASLSSCVQALKEMSTKNTIHGKGNHLEKDKILRIRWCSLVCCRQLFNDSMRVAFNDTPLKLLRGRKVILLGVDKVSSGQLADRKLQSERLVCRNSLPILGEDKLRRGHVVNARNSTDGSRVTRTSLNLLSIRDG